MDKNILAGASLVGTIVGAGVFAIPYAMAKSGILTCFFYFLILGAVVLLLHLFLGEVVLRTEGKHRLVGYTEKYLGKKAKAIVGVATILGTIGALLAYLILLGDFSKIIFPSFLTSWQWVLIWWAVLSCFVFWGIKLIASLELLMGIAMFAVIFVVFGFSIPQFQASNLVLADPRQIFLPFGIILFSLVGWNAIPEIKDLLPKKKNLKKVIIGAVLFSAVFYFLFGLIISAVTGSSTTQEAFNGLVPFLGYKIMILGAVFGLFSVATSFLILGNYLKNTLALDYRVPSFVAFFAACFSPLILFLWGFRQFIGVVSVVGTFVGLVEGTTIALLFLKARKKSREKSQYVLKNSRPLAYLAIVILLAGAIAQIIYHFLL